ncbi:hypothetical protein ACOI1H_10930 [Loktanella sp. DJP18]|uniref:hypothetical protein n=1 Tax=Loktanella sp. DJP18 TaxID=3409788 RepID=UPI003BB66D3E
MNPRWLLRTSQWARNPPSAGRVWLVLGVIAACLALAGIERLTGAVQSGGQEYPRPFTSN